MQLRDSVALVTGANRGIGIALVESLLERGASRVYATGRQLATLAAAVALDEKRVVPLRIDVTRPSDFVRASAIATDVSTDMLREFRIPKTSPRSVAAAIVAGIEAGTEDIFPDSDSAQIYKSWAADHKAVERQFSTL